jgi:hypothetical protein
MVHVPEVDGLTQARRLADAGLMARELIAVTLDVPVEDIEVTVTVAAVDGIDVAAIVATIRDERATAARLERDASARAAALARDLVAKGLPMRDVGSILGVSHQRAHQLASTT